MTELYDSDFIIQFRNPRTKPCVLNFEAEQT